MIVTLETPEQTLAFGEKLGQALVCMSPLPTVLLFGDLGAGKTTMVRGLVGGLPGSDDAEVTSPSFNIVNHYPTKPPVAHVDLYRLDSGAFLDDELTEVLHDESALVVVEWAERLLGADRPEQAVELIWKVHAPRREVTIHAPGPSAALLARAMKEK